MGLIRSLINKVQIRLASNEEYIEILRKKGVKIGNNCQIAKSVEFGTEPYLVEIGNDVRLTNGVKFITHDGGIWVLRNMGLSAKNADKCGRIIIKNNCNIGWDAAILPGVTIGENCIIGCNAVVTKDIPDNSVAAGVPAKVIETIDEYAKKNLGKLVLTKGMEEKDRRIFLEKNF